MKQKVKSSAKTSKNKESKAVVLTNPAKDLEMNLAFWESKGKPLEELKDYLAKTTDESLRSNMERLLSDYRLYTKYNYPIEVKRVENLILSLIKPEEVKIVKKTTRKKRKEAI